MINTPKTDKGNQKSPKNLERAVSTPSSSNPAEAAKEHKHSYDYTYYSQKGMRAVKACWGGFVKVVNWLDAKAGFVTGIATVLIAFLTGAYVRYSAAQWKVMRDQLPALEKSSNAAKDAADTASRELKLSERPWIRITRSAMSVAPNQGILCRIYLANLGKTPAKNVHGAFTIEMVTNGQSPEFIRRPNYLTEVINLGRIRAVDNGEFQAIFPGDDPKENSLQVIWGTDEKSVVGQHFIPRILSKSEYNEALNGKAYFAVYGWVIYKDGFDTFHWTQLCAWEIPVSNVPHDVTAEKCTAYNDADNN